MNDELQWRFAIAAIVLLGLSFAPAAASEHDPHHRLGFVSGLVECRRDEKKPSRYSKPIEWYVRALSQWFGVSEEDPGEIDPKRSEAKIANALERFHD